MDVGSELRQAREQRGLSLRQVSDLTKITPSTLQAIENNNSAGLPGGIFTRGFVKAYAREVGLDPNATAFRYAAQFEPPRESVESGLDRASPTVGASASHVSEQLTVARSSRFRASGVIAAIVLTAVCYVTFSRWPGSDRSNRAEAVSAGDLSAANRSPRQEDTVARSETAATGTSDSGASSAGESENVLRLELHASGPSWVSATADGKRVAYRLMSAGDRQTIKVRDELVLRVGNPATLGFSINGAPGRPLGRAGEAVTVWITPHNHHEFLVQ